MIDIHGHIDFEEFDKNRDDVIKRAEEKLSAFINSGTNYESIEKTLELSRKHKFIHSTLGFHPNYAVNSEQCTIDQTVKTIEENIDEIVAIGETGLDFHNIEDYESRKRQEKVFHTFAKLASEYELPIVLHVRDAENQAYDIIKRYQDIPEVIFHCYSGDMQLAYDLIDRHYYISVPTMITKSKKHKKLAKRVPIENILTETDCPYLSPFPGIQNEPSFVEEAVKKIADVKKMEVSEVNKITEKNAKKVFKI